MSNLKLNIQTRELKGNPVRKLRRQGLVPSVIYGTVLQESVLAQLDLNQFIKVFRVSGKTSVVDLQNEASKESYPVLVQDLDLDPVTGVIRHIDFLAVNLKEKVEAEVPLVLVNEAPAVKEFGAIVNQNLNAIQVLALPDKIPHEIEVNLEILTTLDSVIHISDLIHSTDYEILLEDSEVVASVVMPVEETEEEIAVQPIEETPTAETPANN